MSQENNIFPEFKRMLQRDVKEARLKQRGSVFWLYGLSGSGKSTLALALERKLWEEGFFTQVLDGDNIRSGLNQDLGFSDEDRTENIRRISEVAKLFAQTGIVTLASFITPQRSMREQAKAIVGADDFHEIYVKCSFEQCAERDVKGLYAKAKAGGVASFTGKDSSFEEPETAQLIIDTENQEPEESLAILHKYVTNVIS